MELITAEITKQLTKRSYSDKTRTTYLYWIKCLINFHGERKLTDYKEEEIIDFLENVKLVQKLSHNTIRQAISSMSFAFNKIGRNNFTFSSIQVGKKVSKDLYIPTQSEILKIIESAPSLKYKLAFSLMYSMGLSIGEITDIKLKEIDLDKNTIQIAYKKSRVIRNAIIAEKIKPDLNAYLKAYSNSQWLFENKKGEKVDSSSFQKSLRKVSKELSLNESLTVRMLRTAYIKHLELMGVKLDVILDELGFAKERFTRQHAVHYYSTLDIKVKKINFSPLDRILDINNDIESVEPYISDIRINELLHIDNLKYDITKVVKILNEINIANVHKMYLTIPLLIRSLIDHMAPIFGFRTFSEVTNNYNSTKSFKKSMLHLNNSLRNIADSFLHSPIRKSEVLPTFNQINFKADIDLLLSEVIRIHKT